MFHPVLAIMMPRCKGDKAFIIISPHRAIARVTNKRTTRWIIVSNNRKKTKRSSLLLHIAQAYATRLERQLLVAFA